MLESSSRDERSGALTLRIPAKRFDDAMLALRGLAGELEGEVEFQDITGQDVTAEFIDLGARLDILQDRRDLLRDIQADATSSSEILRLAALIDDVTAADREHPGPAELPEGPGRRGHDQGRGARARRGSREDPGPDTENPSLADSFELAVQGFLRIVGAIVIGLGYLIPLGVIALLVLGRAHAGAASRSRSQLSARKRSAAAEATWASSPARPSVAPNQASASSHAASISSSGRSRPSRPEAADRPVARDRLVECAAARTRARSRHLGRGARAPRAGCRAPPCATSRRPPPRAATTPTAPRTGGARRR